MDSPVPVTYCPPSYAMGYWPVRPFCGGRGYATADGGYVSSAHVSAARGVPLTSEGIGGASEHKKRKVLPEDQLIYDKVRRPSKHGVEI